MREYLLSIVAMSLLAPTAVLAQKPGPVEVEQQMRLHKMKVEMGRHETDVKFQEEMRKLEMEKQRLQLDRERKKLGFANDCAPCRKALRLLLLGCVIVHILTAIWVYGDIRQRGSGSGIWIVVVLLAGLLAVIAYAVVRLGDINSNSRRARR